MNSAENETTEQTGKPGPADSAEQLAHELYRFAAAEMAAGHPDEAVIAMLIERGVTAESAAEMIKPLRAAENEVASQAGTKNMILGATFCIGGVVFTLAVHYSGLQVGTNKTMIAWCAIVFGPVQFICGAIQRFL